MRLQQMFNGLESVHLRHVPPTSPLHDPWVCTLIYEYNHFVSQSGRMSIFPNYSKL